MTNNPTTHRHRRRGSALIAAAALTGSAVLLAACGSSSTPAATPVASAAPADAGAGTGSTQPTASIATEQVLPVDTNPITNASTTQEFTIDSVLVENNVDATGAAADDHLEIAVTNTSGTEVSGFEIFYTYADPTTSTTESYYAALPDDFTIAAAATRVIHFDNTGAPDHFPVNAFSLYHTDTNALDVTVEVSATNAAPQTAKVQKDAGGAEVPD